MIQPYVLEGTWEEIKRHDEELAGKQVHLTILPSEVPDGEAELTLEESERLLDDLARLGKHLPPLPNETYSRETIYGEHD